MKVTKILGGMLLLLMLMTSAFAVTEYNSSNTQISECGTITEAGVYNISSSFTGNILCLTLYSNIVIEGNSHAITKNSSLGTGAFLQAGGLSNVSIKNLEIRNYSIGFAFNGISNLTLDNITISDNTNQAFIIINSPTTEIVGANFMGNPTIQNNTPINIVDSKVYSTLSTSVVNQVGSPIAFNVTIVDNTTGDVIYTGAHNNSFSTSLLNYTFNPVVHRNYVMTVSSNGFDTNVSGPFNLTAPITSVTLFDTTAPVFTVSVGTIYSNNDVSFQFNATDVSGINTWTVNNTNFSITNGLLLNTSPLLDGNYSLNITVNDTFGNVNYTPVVVVIDTEAPQFGNNPNVTITVGQSVSITMNASDNVGITSWTVDDTANFSISSSGVLTNAVALSNGTYVLNITATDASGNSNSTTFQVTVNTPPAPQPPATTGGSGGGNVGPISIVSTPVEEETTEEETEEDTTTGTGTTEPPETDGAEETDAQATTTEEDLPVVQADAEETTPATTGLLIANAPTIVGSIVALVLLALLIIFAVKKSKGKPAKKAKK